MPDALFHQRAAFIARSRGLSYLGGGMYRLWSTLLVALALLAAPMAMASGAMANTPHAAPHAAASSSAHCAGDEMPIPDGQPEHLSCAAACAALPALPPPSGAAPAPVSARLVAAPDATLLGFEPEGETPPPRMTPVI